MLGALRKLKTVLVLAGQLAELEKLNKKGAPMSKFLPIIVTIIATVSSAVAFPDFVAQHATAYAILNAIAQGLHALLPGLGQSKPAPASIGR